MAVVRRQGYDGASIAELSKATGLGKSSLYHYFPEGKDDMVAAVLAFLEDSLEANVFAPLREPGAPAARLRRMCEALDEFYHSGREACLLASLGIGDSAKPFHPRVKKVFRTWIDAIATPLRDSGLSRAVAQTRAEDALVRNRGRVGDAALTDARAAGLGDGEIVEVVAHVALNVFTNYLNNLVGTEVDFPLVAVDTAA